MPLITYTSTSQAALHLSGLDFFFLSEWPFWDKLLVLKGWVENLISQDKSEKPQTAFLYSFPLPFSGYIYINIGLYRKHQKAIAWRFLRLAHLHERATKRRLRYDLEFHPWELLGEVPDRPGRRRPSIAAFLGPDVGVAQREGTGGSAVCKKYIKIPCIVCIYIYIL